MILKVGIVGTGNMARWHAQEFKRLRGVRLQACLDVNRERAKAFAAEHGVRMVCDTLEQVLDATDAVAIVTPDGSHVPLALQALRAGRHVLCEKPLATSLPDALRAAAAARRARGVHMINFSYRRSSAVQQAMALVRAGALGRLFHVESSYLQSWLLQDAWGHWTSEAWAWRLQTASGSGGVLGDIGCHLLDLTTAVAGELDAVRAVLQTFPKGVPGERLNGKKLDANDTCMAHLRFRRGALGHCIVSRWASGHINSVALQVHGELGALKIDLDKSWTDLYVCRGKDLKTQTWRTLTFKPGLSNHQRFIRAIRRGQNDQPDFIRGAQVQAYLDACVRSAATGTFWKIKQVEAPRRD